MDETLKNLQQTALADISAAVDEAALESLRVSLVGRSGSVSLAGEQMRNVPKEQRPILGKLLNETRTLITEALAKRQAELVALKDAAAAASIDVTLPAVPQPSPGALHPITLLQDRVVQIFRRMGFALADGPDIDDEWHNFDALNTPPDHPARNDTDTYYLPDGRLLRAHTSTVQIRTMLSQVPPVQIIAPGAAYRRDEVDATHLNQFNQVEGLYVAPNVSVADLKGSVEFFLRELLGTQTEVRFRPHFFPFTEPSFEVDAKLPGTNKWLELAGCGIVDPAVFEAVNARRGDNAYDPEVYTGWAFGFGLDRLTMVMTGTTDIRLLIENDVRYLSQFRQ